jgi:hypothetical protein
MNKKQFAHTIRAAAAILGVKEVLIIESQAAHASINKEFPALNLSIETNIAILGDTDGKMADLIDGSIGEASMFQETFGYYAQGVEPQTAILPEGWKQRLIPFSSPETNGVTAQCLELHDLWVSKAMASRTKDRKYCNELLKRKYVKPEILYERLKTIKRQPAEKITLAQAWIEEAK